MRRVAGQWEQIEIIATANEGWKELTKPPTTTLFKPLLIDPRRPIAPGFTRVLKSGPHPLLTHDAIDNPVILYS